MYPVSVSISATEHQNVVLRNTLGRIAANLQLLIQFETERNRTHAGSRSSPPSSGVHDTPHSRAQSRANGADVMGVPVSPMASRRDSNGPFQHGATELAIIDLMVDEGHRLGISYLYRALSIVFYTCLPKQVALRIATGWLRKMNVCEGASSTDDFDHVDLFAFLEPRDKKRSEFVLLEMVHKMVGPMNQFKKEVGLFEKILEMPLLGKERYTRVLGLIERPSSNASREMLFEALHRECGLDADLTFEPKRSTSKSCDVKFLLELLQERSSADGSEPARANGQLGYKGFTLSDALRLLKEAQSSRVFDSFAADTHMERAAMSGFESTVGLDQTDTENEFFTPQVFQHFGRLIGGGMKGEFEIRGDRRIPCDMASFVETLRTLPSADAMSSMVWVQMRSHFSSGEREELRAALDPFHYSFDHIVDVLGDSPHPPAGPMALRAAQIAANNPRSGRSYAQCVSPVRIGAVYAARGNPTKWQPKTKPSHRREIRPDVWICENPEYPGNTHTYPVPRPTGDTYTTLNLPKTPQSAAARKEMAQTYWRSRQHVGLVLADGQRAHFFGRDSTLTSAPSTNSLDVNNRDSTMERTNSMSSMGAGDTDPETANDVSQLYQPDPDVIRIDAKDAFIDELGREVSWGSGKRVPKYVPVNKHLGKAGGLNFGLQTALMKIYEAELDPPSEKLPMFFAITDARHAGDERWWLHVLPPFFATNPHDTTDGAVAFDKSIALVQVAHSYLGIKEDKDHLDMRNDFMFTGMAVVRDQAYGMTSCGTGGIWSITQDDGLQDYFFGRTMIEDTASSTEVFLQGRKSVYVTPFANKPAEQQLMCAVPKVSANFLEALERWDKGAVQCFCAQAATFTKSWFWISLLVYGMMAALFLTPAFWPMGLNLVLHHEWSDIWTVVTNPTSPSGSITDEFMSILMIVVPATIWVLILIFMLLFQTCAPVRFNFGLRYTVLFFNHTYPYNSFTSVWWIALPFWIVFSGKFPFNFDPIFAIAGALILRAIEWVLVITYKGQAQRNGTQLREVSIFKSQQLNMATVPVKLRAICLGIHSGLADVWGKHDNSFWISFGGTPQAVVYVQLWLAACMITTVAAIIAGIVRICVQRDEPTVIMATVFGMVLCMINGWILVQPSFFVWKNRQLKVSLRHTEVVVLAVLGVAVIVTVILSGQSSIGIFAHGN